MATSASVASFFSVALLMVLFKATIKKILDFLEFAHQIHHIFKHNILFFQKAKVQLFLKRHTKNTINNCATIIRKNVVSGYTLA